MHRRGHVAASRAYPQGGAKIVLPRLRALAEASSRHQPCERRGYRQFAVANHDPHFAKASAAETVSVATVGLNGTLIPSALRLVTIMQPSSNLTRQLFMVPCARTTQRWPLRPWRSQRKMYVVIYRGAPRRRMRRVRLRVFTNVRTATRNLDLPLAIRESPIACQPFPTATGGLGPVQGGNMAGFFSVTALRLPASQTKGPGIGPGPGRGQSEHRVRRASAKHRSAIFVPARDAGGPVHLAAHVAAVSHGLAVTARNWLKQEGNSCDMERHEAEGKKSEKCPILLAIPAGFEPATHGVEIRPPAP
jgi:hypothetical protein